jgi:putative ABC transport system permease protein
VVGVAPSILYDEVDNLGPQSRLQVHLPYARLPWQEMALLVRTHGDPAALAGPLRRAVRELDPTVPVYSLRTMDEVRRWSNWPSRLWGELFGTFGGVALLLAGVGVYGVMAYAVSQRVHEIGIRMALGARAADVVRMVMRQGAVVAAAGVGAGLLGALAIARLMSGVLFGVSATDLVTFVAMPLALAAVALFACWMPARRAARVDPMVALRSE